MNLFLSALYSRSRNGFVIEDDDSILLMIFEYLMIKGLYIHGNIWEQKRKVILPVYLITK